MARLVTRRGMLRTSAGAALGLTGVAVLAACGETAPQIITKGSPSRAGCGERSPG